jgi:hypothetical protein
MALRLDLSNPEHRKLLESRKSKETGNSLLHDVEKDILTNKNRIGPVTQDFEKNQINISYSHKTQINLALNRSDNLEQRNQSDNSKRNKYRNKRVIDPLTNNLFDSQFELECWYELCNLEKQKKIRKLTRQNHYDLIVNDIKIVGIEPDFDFIIGDVEITADAKSEATQGTEFQMKWKLFKALFGREIVRFTIDYKPWQFIIDFTREMRKTRQFSK